jgi:signal peptidase
MSTHQRKPGGQSLRRSLDLLLIGLIGTVLFGVALVRGVPLLGGTTLVVRGPSMEPAIPVGAAIVITPVDPAQLDVGEIVSVRPGPGNAIFSHRIIRIVDREGEIWLETKGDANPVPEPAIIPASSVIGRVQLMIPWVGYLVALLSIPSGVAVLIGLAGILLTASWLLESAERGGRPAPRVKAQTKVARKRRSSADA